MRRAWQWCLKCLPEDRTNRYLVVTVIVSVIFHIFVFIGLIVGGDMLEKMIAKRGEALLVDMAPDKPKSRPRSAILRAYRPRHAEPRTSAPPAPPAPRAAPTPPAPAAPRVAEAPKPPPQAPQSADPGPAPKAAPPAPAPDQGQSAKAASQTPAAPPQPAAQPPAPAADQRVASAPPQPQPAAGMFRRGGGGGLRGGRGGIEGEPIPLDTPEPKFQDYFNQVRERIKSKWIYPYEASSRGIEGELQIEFGIAKSGELQFIARRRSSGVELLDDYAMRAVQLASPFPPVPDAISKGGLPINGIFRYHILSSGLINNYLR
jgi:TonB family protein